MSPTTFMPSGMLKTVLTAGAFLFHIVNGHSEQFSEHLDIRPLPDGHVASTFTFSTAYKNASPRKPETLNETDLPQHYTLFPLSLGQIIREYAITEFHLSLNAGEWDYSRWGYPEEEAVGSGAELWAYIAAGDDELMSIDARWKGLRNSLAGLFCSSLDSMGEQRTTSPVHAFRPEGALPRFRQRHVLRHATLPSESICTENLTPFLKLLPCKSHSGLAQLLNPHKLFDADWHGMGVHVFWNKDAEVVVRLTFQAVLDPVRVSNHKRRDWSFRSLFDRNIEKMCPVASFSSARVILPYNEYFALSPEPLRSHDGHAWFNLTEDTDISMRWSENEFTYPLEVADTPLSLSNFSIMRSLTGPNQSRGRLSVSISNHRATELKLIYLETLPWLVHLYLHTMQMMHDGKPRNDLVSLITYEPPVPHGRPMLFEALLTIPSHSTVSLTFDVAKSFLRYTEHPPDAQRGWDLPPAVLVPVTDLASGANHTADSQRKQNRVQARTRMQRMYSRALLVDLATPDFSMPYNVIMMTCTPIALFFGFLFNLFIRTFLVVRTEVSAAQKQD